MADSDYNWITNSGAGPNLFTGPSFDHTFGSGFNGFYAIAGNYKTKHKYFLSYHLILSFYFFYSQKTQKLRRQVVKKQKWNQKYSMVVIRLDALNSGITCMEHWPF
jgi:hypothetical protein